MNDKFEKLVKYFKGILVVHFEESNEWGFFDNNDECLCVKSTFLECVNVLYKKYIRP